MTTTRTRRPDVDDRPYVRSHGRPPRGRGYWLFGVDDPDPYGTDGGGDAATLGAAGTYTEARRTARAEAPAGTRLLYVLP